MARSTVLTILLSAILLLMSGCTLFSGLPDSSALRQLKEMAQAGDVESQYQLGMHYTIQSRWVLDHSRGYQWFLEAAEQGHADAQYMVGMGKIVVRGTRYDPAGSIEYFSRAAVQGQARAQYQLGNAYLNGTGVTKDKSWGRQWLEQAAWSEHKEAQFILGALFAEGIGGQADQVEAWRWLQRASKNGQNQAEKALKTLSSRLTEQERDAGDQLLTQRPDRASGSLYTLPQIRYVQSTLNRLGYSAGPEDGIEGSATRAAIAHYIQKNGLSHETQALQLIEILRGDHQ